MKLIIGNKTYSSWSLRPWLLMKHFMIPFEEVLVKLDLPAMKEWYEGAQLEDFIAVDHE